MDDRQIDGTWLVGLLITYSDWQDGQMMYDDEWTDTDELVNVNDDDDYCQQQIGRMYLVGIWLMLGIWYLLVSQYGT